MPGAVAWKAERPHRLPDQEFGVPWSPGGFQGTPPAKAGVPPGAACQRAFPDLLHRVVLEQGISDVHLRAVTLCSSSEGFRSRLQGEILRRLLVDRNGASRAHSRPSRSVRDRLWPDRNPRDHHSRDCDLAHAQWSRVAAVTHGTAANSDRITANPPRALHATISPSAASLPRQSIGSEG